VSDYEDLVGQDSSPSDQGWRLNQVAPALLIAAVLSVAGLFLQVAKLDQSVGTLLADLQEMKNDSKERLKELEGRVRQLEMTALRGK
jgi:hypothetical protein